MAAVTGLPVISVDEICSRAHATSPESALHSVVRVAVSFASTVAVLCETSLQTDTQWQFSQVSNDLSLYKCRTPVYPFTMEPFFVRSASVDACSAAMALIESRCFHSGFLFSVECWALLYWIDLSGSDAGRVCFRTTAGFLQPKTTVVDTCAWNRCYSTEWQMSRLT